MKRLSRRENGLLSILVVLSLLVLVGGLLPEPDLDGWLGAILGPVLAALHRGPYSELVDLVSGLATVIGLVVAFKQSGAAEPSSDGGTRQDRPVPPLAPAVAPPPAVPPSPYATSRFAFRHQVERDFLGRETELAWLDRAWAAGLHIVSIVAWGGVGKTALVAHWLHTRFFARDFRPIAGLPGPDAYFDWSFYDQGTVPAEDSRAARVGSVGSFFERALVHFGDPDPNRPGQGERLAGLVQARRTLFVIDGLEPLQAPPDSARPGRLLDPDLETFIRALLQRNPELLVITSRQALPDLEGAAALCDQRDLHELARANAIRLLRQFQVTGTEDELAAACERFSCHALSLTLLGRFLFDAHGGDIRCIDQIDLHSADRATPDRHRTAWKVLAAYENWLCPPQSARASAPRPAGGWAWSAAGRTWRRIAGALRGRRNPQAATAARARRRTLAVLRLTGLFDRPASPDCLAALRAAPSIRGLTDALTGLDEDGWRALLRGLERARLIRLSAHAGGALGLDAHPLVRDYFAEQLRLQRPAAFAAAHARLFEHLCAATPHRPDDLAGLQPLYQAVRHGCLAGRQQEACDKVYVERILRGTGNDGFYSQNKLGAIGANLGAVAAFFDAPWGRVSPNLAEPDRAWLLNEAAVLLRALGRLTEALGPMRVCGETEVQVERWKNAAIGYSNLSELEITLGRLPDAVTDARAAVAHADRSGDAFQRMSKRTAAADALHQSGETAEAGRLFAEAERMQREWQPQYPLLYSLGGFRYCDWLLAPAERAAWRVLGGAGFQPAIRTAATAQPAGPPVPDPATAANPPVPRYPIPRPPPTRTDWPRPTRSRPVLKWSGGRRPRLWWQKRMAGSSTSPSTT
jgi:tetratricopeptide (TPR) repeat protein